jgi:hypothetical protein
LASIRRTLAELRGLPLWTLSQAALLEVTREVEATLRCGFGVQVRLAGELHERGVADMLDARSAAHLLQQTLQITMSDARGRVAAAVASLPTETPSGGVIAPPAPELLSAIERGAVSAGHAKVITGCLAKIPEAVDADTRQLCLATLIEQAGMRDEIGLRRVAEQITNLVDPDGELSDKDAEDRAEFHIGSKRQDGLTPVRGLLSPLTAEQLRVAIHARSMPRPIDENTPDPRPAPLRNEQALGEILSRHLCTGAGPRDGGVRPQVVVTISLQDLIVGLRRYRARQDAANAADADEQGHTQDSDAGRFAEWTLQHGWEPPGGWASYGLGGSGSSGANAGSAWSDYDGIQSVAMARLLACDAVIIPQVLGTDSVVLDQGRGVRLFTAAQRRALTTRDKGCAFLGCDIPAPWCEAHHIVWWSDGGVTDISNGVLLCRRHHVLIHQGRWRIEQDPDGGRPWILPPAHIDPARAPRRNTYFHVPDLLTTISRQ